MEEKNENRINIENILQAEQELTTAEAKDVKGGIGQLLPAIQKVRDDGPATQSGGTLSPGFDWLVHRDRTL